MRLEDLCPVPIPADLGLPEQVVIGPGVRRELPRWAAEYCGARPVLLADPQTWEAAKLDAEAWPRRHLLPSHPHTDDATIEALVNAMRRLGATGIVAVGSGTINDLAKRASAVLGLRFVVLGTASSMNGYASGIAAVLSNGLKTTVPCDPARVIILDTEVLAKAPPAMTQAGLGDLLSKPVSDSDWWVASFIEGGAYSDLPNRLVGLAVNSAAAAAEGLAHGSLDAHQALATALVLSGVAMVVAGSSAPASGGEHLISHLWDMERLTAGLETRLHGAQVGVATIITAALYQRILSATPRFDDPPDEAVESARIDDSFGSLAAAVQGPARQKRARAAQRLEILRTRWPELRAGLLARGLPTPAQARTPLVAVGGPNTLAELGIDPAYAVDTLLRARDIRDRLTVLDLAFEVGVLPDAAQAVLKDAGV